MHLHYRCALASTMLLTNACGSAAEITAASGSAKASASSAVSSATASTTPRSSVSPPPPVASPSASAAASSSVFPCPEGARKDDKLRYCVTLPPNPLAISYEGDDPKKGIREELEIAGNRVVIQVGPMLPGATVATLKESALKVNAQTLLESGDLRGGFWMHLKRNGQNILESVVIAGSYQVICTFEVGDEKHLETARNVVKSLMAF